MVYAVNITSQGQISIPAKVRRKIGFKKRAIVSVEKDRVIIRPVADFMDLMGSLKTNKRLLSNREIHELYAQGVASGEV